MMSNISTARRYVRFNSAVGEFAYVLDEMQIYPWDGGAPDWKEPLLSKGQASFVEPDYAKATISVITGCNLECGYCIYGTLPSNQIRRMEPETGRTIIDYLCGAFGSAVKRITLSFTSNGEPTLNLIAIEAIKAYCREKSAQGSPTFRFNFATNAISLSLETIGQYLEETDQEIFFSVDGPPHLHNCLRTNHSGDGSYDATVRKLAFYRERYEKYDKGFSSSTVLTAREERFDDILLHLDALGFEYIVIRPIRGAKDTGLGLNANTLPIFRRGYARMLDLIEAKALDGDIGLLHKVCNRYDFFGRLFSALILDEARTQGCPGCPPKHSDIARYSLVFDTDGKVYFPCRDFIGRTKFCLGSIYDQVDLSRVRQIMFKIRTGERRECLNCWARTLCGGGCYNAALAATGTIEQPDEHLCELIRYIAERAVRMAYALARKQPNVIPVLTQRAIAVSPWTRNVAIADGLG